MILTHHHSLPIMYLFHASIHIHLDLPDWRGDLARDISSSSLVHCKMLVEAFPPSSFVFLVFLCWGVVGVLRVKLMFYSVRANVKDIGYNSVDQSSLATPILARTQSNVWLVVCALSWKNILDTLFRVGQLYAIWSWVLFLIFCHNELSYLCFFYGVMIVYNLKDKEGYQLKSASDLIFGKFQHLFNCSLFF